MARARHEQVGLFPLPFTRTVRPATNSEGEKREQAVESKNAKGLRSRVSHELLRVSFRLVSET
jgi:hypothetical protein